MCQPGVATGRIGQRSSALGALQGTSFLQWGGSQLRALVANVRGEQKDDQRMSACGESEGPESASFHKVGGKKNEAKGE